MVLSPKHFPLTCHLMFIYHHNLFTLFTQCYLSKTIKSSEDRDLALLAAVFLVPQIIPNRKQLLICCLLPGSMASEQCHFELHILSSFSVGLFGVYACVCVCMYVCLSVCVCMHMYVLWMYICMDGCVCGICMHMCSVSCLWMSEANVGYLPWLYTSLLFEPWSLTEPWAQWFS